MMDRVLREGGNLRGQFCRIDLAEIAGDRHQAGCTGEEFGGAAFVLGDMGFLMAEGDAAGALHACERKRVGGGAGGDEEDRDLAFEDFGEAGFNLLIVVAVAVGGGKIGRFSQQALGNGFMGASPVVGSKKHGRNH